MIAQLAHRFALCVALAAAVVVAASCSGSLAAFYADEYWISLNESTGQTDRLARALRQQGLRVEVVPVAIPASPNSAIQFEPVVNAGIFVFSPLLSSQATSFVDLIPETAAGVRIVFFDFLDNLSVGLPETIAVTRLISNREAAFADAAIECGELLASDRNGGTPGLLAGIFYVGNEERKAEKEAFIDALRVDRERFRVLDLQTTASDREIKAFLKGFAEGDVDLFFVAAAGLTKPSLTLIAAEFDARMIVEEWKQYPAHADRVVGSIDEDWIAAVVAGVTGQAEVVEIPCEFSAFDTAFSSSEEHDRGSPGT